jgi:hypothetical protein
VLTVTTMVPMDATEETSQPPSTTSKTPVVWNVTPTTHTTHVTKLATSKKPRNSSKSTDSNTSFLTDPKTKLPWQISSQQTLQFPSSLTLKAGLSTTVESLRPVNVDLTLVRLFPHVLLLFFRSKDLFNFPFRSRCPSCWIQHCFWILDRKKFLGT